MNTAARRHSNVTLLILAVCALVLYVSFVALGTWQIRRLIWKRALIERVEQRVHVAAGAAPQRVLWPQITAELDEYRRVQVSGVFLNSATTKVLASTMLGRGYWVITPLRAEDGSIILINRGFIPFNARTIAPAGEHDVIGLLRISEPGGGFLHRNRPDRQLWYSRDVDAIAASLHLTDVAPYFIDAEAAKVATSAPTSAQPTAPIAGLTVISFNNNHLVYTLTWFALALMVAGASVYGARAEWRARRGLRADPEIVTP